MLNRRSFALSAAASVLAAPKAFARVQLPKVYTWVGNAGPTLYWDDPDNWAGGEYPNQREAIAVFSHAIRQNTTILLRRDVHVARLWFSEEKYSYTIAADKSAIDPQSRTEPKLILDTIGEYSSTTIDSDNKVDHVITAMITHSCHFGFPDRHAKVNDYISTLHFNGGMSNYMDPRRASLQVNGRLRFQLNAANSFRGPVVAFNEGEVRVTVSGAIPDGTPVYLSNSGKMIVDEGVLVRAGRLVVDDRVAEPGIYHSPTITSISANFPQAVAPAFTKFAKEGRITTFPNIGGRGAILVQ